MKKSFLILVFALVCLASCNAQQQDDNTDIEILPNDDSSQCDSVEQVSCVGFESLYECEPEYPGGTKALLEFIHQNLRYPDSLSESCFQGRVTLSFYIEEDGSITDIQEMRSPHADLTQEAIRVVKLMPKWQPATRNGKPVRVGYMLPITFRLQ